MIQIITTHGHVAIVGRPHGIQLHLNHGIYTSISTIQVVLLVTTVIQVSLSVQYKWHFQSTQTNFRSEKVNISAGGIWNNEGYHNKGTASYNWCTKLDLYMFFNSVYLKLGTSDTSGYTGHSISPVRWLLCPCKSIFSSRRYMGDTNHNNSERTAQYWSTTWSSPDSNLWYIYFNSSNSLYMYFGYARNMRRTGSLSVQEIFKSSYIGEYS